MTSTYTATRTYTRTHTATFLTGAVMGAISNILSRLKIDDSRLYRNWAQIEKGINAWIGEGALKAVVLECVTPSGTVAAVFEFDVTYSTSAGAEFRASQARLARFNSKIAAVPRGSTYRIVCTFKGTASSQPGWSSTQRASTAGLRPTSFGTLGRAPDATASMRYLR